MARVAGREQLAANWRQVSEMSRGQQDSPLCPLSTVAMSGTKQAHHMHHTQTHDLEGVWKCLNRKIFQHLLVINF